MRPRFEASAWINSEQKPNLPLKEWVSIPPTVLLGNLQFLSLILQAQLLQRMCATVGCQTAASGGALNSE